MTTSDDIFRSTDDWQSSLEVRDTHATNPLMDIFATLWKHSSDDHALTPDDIIDLLQADNRQNSFYKAPSRDTVVNQLQYLEYSRILGREVRRTDDGETPDGEENDSSRWYMAPVLSPSEVRLLEDSLMLSRIDPEELQGVISGLYQLAGGSTPSKDLPDISIDGYEHINGEFLTTVEKITEAMNSQLAVDFSYCDYDEHGTLVKRLDHRTGKPRRYVFDPYNMVYKKGGYYLLGHFHNQPIPQDTDQNENHTNLFCFAVDRIRNLRVTGTRITVPAGTWDENGLPRALTGAPRFDAVAFARQRPHMTMGTLVDVVMSVGPGMLTNVYEWFDDPKVERVNGPFDPDDSQEGIETFHYRVSVRSPKLGIIWWALQYALSDVRVESPQSVRDELLRAGLLLTRRYSDE
ncbi:WYL domain-containing protein [Bifidobacterium thermophilum]|uniref:helix-turn-helix transcriptional regulator n=1 Tax=Bifidobacterium thermophilum TaxID=33905 RepID=UPI0030969A0F